jgi:hypothetical protein
LDIQQQYKKFEVSWPNYKRKRAEVVDVINMKIRGDDTRSASRWAGQRQMRRILVIPDLDFG